ncbi:arylsulfatase [Lewinella sp. W8]|uniref:arylsulfatase n=1 Tax=Lewinella sp. W8 TaxID=2528208 RepID=UPI001068C50B|nr:arylsulfatase [Lewinella sp. W8]MTB51424.1 sulfatase-like hydrolase/transferase [Lewinella sp. W8]
MFRSLLFVLCCPLLICCHQNPPDDQLPPPNIIYILADDLGYGELGVYGQDLIETPHLDALAKGGMRFTQHYTGAPVCAPARGVLLMGKHTGHAHVRGNDEDGTRGDVWNYRAMLDDPSLEGQRPIPDSLITLGEVLQEGGYRTALVGKWGLGAPGSEGVPNRQGFDYFYGYNCQRQAHNLYPTHLWENDQRVFLNNELMAPHQEHEQGEDQTDDEFFNQFILEDYAPELMHRAALEFIEEQRDTPFFLYYASPLPHVPLQAPQRWVDHYREKLGPEAAYREKAYFPCQYPRATYAAMISYLDEQVGDLVAKLKELGQYENTLIIFSSDNGPSYAGGAASEFFDSAQPFRAGYGFAKGFVHEGGIRVPMIAHWPTNIKPGTRTDHISGFQDILPTLAEVAGRTPPANDGISFLPTLLGEEQRPHDHLYWEFPAYRGQQAVRKGRWKAIRKDLQEGRVQTELYDLETDPQETQDVAGEHPEVVAEMEAIMLREHVPSPFPRFQYAVFGEK